MQDQAMTPTDDPNSVFLMGCALIWMVHNFLVWSLIAAVMEASFFISNVLGFLRYYQDGGVERSLIQERKK